MIFVCIFNPAYHPIGNHPLVTIQIIIELVYMICHTNNILRITSRLSN